MTEIARTRTTPPGGGHTERYRPLERADAERARSNFVVLAASGRYWGCRDCDQRPEGSRPVFDREEHDRWHDEGCPEQTPMAGAGGGHTADSDTIRDYIFPSLKRPHVNADEAVAALARLEAAANRTAEAERERDEERSQWGIHYWRAEAAEAERDAALAALREECRCGTCKGDGLYRCVCDKQVCTCRVNEVPRPPCYACGGSGIRPRTPVARAVLGGPDA